MTTRDYKRKVTAILSADVKGYSRLTSEDEDATIRTLTAYRNAMSNLVQQSRGHMVDALNCPVEIRRKLGERKRT